MNHTVVFGLLAALGWGFGPVLTKRAYASAVTPLAATAVQLVIGVSVLWTLGVSLHGSVPFHSVSVATAWPFVVSGVIGGALGRYMLYWGIDNIGSSITSSLAATDPVFGGLIAMVVLSEVPTRGQLIGVVFTMSSVILVSASAGGNRSGWQTRLVVVPLLAAALYGTAAALRRYAFGVGDIPILFAVAISETTALVVVSSVGWTHLRERFSDMSVTGYRYMFASGLSYTLGTVAVFAALDTGPVVISVALGSVAPLITVIVVHLFLQNQERVPAQVIAGTGLAVCGVIFLAV